MNRRNSYIRAARIFGPDEVTIEDDAEVKESGDGALVAGWIRVTNDQACICPYCGEDNWEFENDPKYCEGCDKKQKRRKGDRQ